MEKWHFFIYGLNIVFVSLVYQICITQIVVCYGASAILTGVNHLVAEVIHQSYNQNFIFN